MVLKTEIELLSSEICSLPEVRMFHTVCSQFDKACHVAELFSELKRMLHTSQTSCKYNNTWWQNEFPTLFQAKFIPLKLNIQQATYFL